MPPVCETARNRHPASRPGAEPAVLLRRQLRRHLPADRGGHRRPARHPRRARHPDHFPRTLPPPLTHPASTRPTAPSTAMQRWPGIDWRQTGKSGCSSAILPRTPVFRRDHAWPRPWWRRCCAPVRRRRLAKSPWGQQRCVLARRGTWCGRRVRTTAHSGCAP